MTRIELRQAVLDRLEQDGHQVLMIDYLSSTDNALQLPIENDMYWEVEIYQSHHPFPNHVQLCAFPRDTRGFSSRDTIPESICRAWLMWKKAMEANQCKT